MSLRRNLLLGIFVLVLFAGCQSGLSELEVEQLVQEQVTAAKAEISQQLLTEFSNGKDITLGSNADSVTTIKGSLVVEDVITTGDLISLRGLRAINSESKAAASLSVSEKGSHLRLFGVEGDLLFTAGSGEDGNAALIVNGTITVPDDLGNAVVQIGGTGDYKGISLLGPQGEIFGWLTVLDDRAYLGIDGDAILSDPNSESRIGLFSSEGGSIILVGPSGEPVALLTDIENKGAEIKLFDAQGRLVWNAP